MRARERARDRERGREGEREKRAQGCFSTIRFQNLSSTIAFSTKKELQ